MARNIVDGASVTLSPKRYFVNVVEMQLRVTPAEREYKEKVNRKKQRKREVRLGIVSKPPRPHSQI